MRREADHFGEQELRLLYLAQKLKHALRLEQLLTDSGIDYLVETGDMRSASCFDGACRRVLLRGSGPRQQGARRAAP